MKFPIYAKIISWFFLNLLLLGLLGWLFLGPQFKPTLDSLLMGSSGERVQAVAELIATELRTLPVEKWSEVLQRFDSAYRADFYIFQEDGKQLSGKPITLPPEVRRRLAERMGPPPTMMRGWGGMRGELPEGRMPDPKGFLEGIPPGGKEMKPQGSGRQFRADSGRNPNQPGDAERTIVPFGQRFEGNRNPGDNGLRPGEPRVNPPMGGYPDGGRNPLIPGGPFGRFFMRSEQPKAYWIGVHLPRVEMSFPPRHSSSLVIHSESLSGILFFDATPWLLFGGLAMLVSVLFWLPMVQNLTRSISRITMATEQIADGKFDTGVDERRNDELGRLGAAINRMAGRLSGFISGQRRFLGDTAHELCSPIARMQMALGILEERVDEKNKPYVEDVREEVQQMSGLVNELLSFSKASFSREHVKLQPVKVAEVLAQAVKRDARPENEVKLTVPNELQVQANADLLQRAVGNLLRNAIRYAGEAGPIQIAARAEGAEVLITVADEGPGVPEGSLAKLFDPFYRVDESRTRETGGIGLGLTIVKTCVAACGGTVSCRNRQPRGLEVAIRLSAG